MYVAGTMFFKDKKLLIDKPRKRPTYQMIGGRVEEGEAPFDAAIRECHEEL
jgi:8-oxo-dGTP pyrophosphatase MutT (NUDIX family)